MRCAAVARLLLFLPVLASPLVAQERIPAGYDEGQFEVVADDIPAVVLPVLVSPAGRYLLPLRALLDPLGIPYRDIRDSTLIRVSRPAGIGFAELQWGRVPRRITVIETSPLAPDEVVMRGLELYLAAPRVAELIESAIDVDVATLSLRISRPGRFPAQIRLDALQRRREGAGRARADAARQLPPVPFVPRTGFGVIEWALGGTGTPLQTPSVVESRVGFGLYGGMLKTRAALVQPAPGAAFAPSGSEVSYHRVFPEHPVIRQFQVGDIVSLGALARPVRGFSLTNAPFVRGMRFAAVPFSRPLPPGWEYEVYEGDRLVAYKDAASRTPMSVPLQYGTTPLRIRLYGPAGEIVESALSYVIPLEQLPPGDLQYAVGGGRCALRLCDRLAYGELRYGVTDRLTVQGGMDELADSVTSIVRPYGAVSFLPGRTWAASVQARRKSYVRASVQNTGDGRVTGSGTVGVNAPGEGGTSIARDSASVWFAQTTLSLLGILPRFGPRALNLNARAEGSRPGQPGRWDVRSTAPLGYGLLDVGLQSDPLAAVRDSGRNIPMFIVAPTISFARGPLVQWGSPLLRVEGGFQAGRLTQWDVALALQRGRAFGNVSLRQLVGAVGQQLHVGGSMALGPGRLLGRLTSSEGRVTSSYSANGAVAFGSVRRAMSLEYGGLGVAGIEGRVFRDADGNGVFSAGDIASPGVTVGVGGVRTQTDSMGRYSAWGALPYEIVEVQVDSLSLEEPGWMPAVPTRLLRPSPHQYTRVDFPLVQTREVVGSLRTAPSMPQPAGVTVELRDTRSGVIHTVRTFSDGGFYFSRVRPGRYLLTISSASLLALRAAPLAPVEVIVSPVGEEAMEIPSIVLSPVR